MGDEQMQQKKSNTMALIVIIAIVVIGAAAAVYFVTKGEKNSNSVATVNTAQNTNTAVTEAPYTMSGNTKVFSLELVNGQLNYKTMTVYAGDSVQIKLTSDGQPVDFQFQNVPEAVSTAGIFNTTIQENDQGGTYYLICADNTCGSIAVTVVPKANVNASASNANASTNAASAAEITKVELQRIPAGTTFSPTDTYETTTSFEVGDLFGLSVTGNFAAGTTLAHTFTDSTGAEIETQSQHPDLQAGTNGSCCYSLPLTAGSYNLKLFVNGAAAQSVPITLE
ncbi:MAG: hypothetical protein WC505_01340 [Patescibacteria group bacterium]